MKTVKPSISFCKAQIRAFQLFVEKDNRPENAAIVQEAIDLLNSGEELSLDDIIMLGKTNMLLCFILRDNEEFFKLNEILYKGFLSMKSQLIPAFGKLIQKKKFDPLNN